MTTTASLIGRESDLESLRDGLHKARSGATQTVVLSGEAGIGKTRLVAEFLGGLPEGTLVLRGQCIDLERDAPPYAPVVALLRSLATAIGLDALALSAGPARDSLAVLLPELRGDDQDADARGAGSAAAAGALGGADRLYDAVATALEAAARERPSVVVIEDLHWADQATLSLVRFVLRVLEQARVLFVLTYRSDELGRGHPLRSWIPELDRNRRVVRRELARLNRRQVRGLVTALRDEPLEPGEFEIVLQRTDGVPFFVEEIIGCDVVSVESVPDTLREILLARYETLGDPAQKVLRLMAAGGVRVEHELLVAVADTPADTLESAVREAVLARLLIADDTGYTFRHALVREAVHDELLPGERIRFHTAFARALDEHDDATAVSYHWMAAHDLRAAFSASLVAMAQARRSFASATAARMGERALELWDQVPDAEALAGRGRRELLAETAYILRNAGESERAVALIDEALTSTTPAEHPAQYARMLRDKASFLANLGQTGSVELLRCALVVLEGEPRSVLRANVLGELAARLMLDACFDDAIATADAAFTEADEVASTARMSVAANIRGFSRLSIGQIDDGLADLALAGRLAEGNDSAQLRYLVNQSDALHLLGRFDEAVVIADEGVEFARRRGVERTSGVMLLANVIAPLLALGRTGRAEELLDRALELEPPIGFSAHLQMMKLQSTLWSGDPATAQKLLRAWRPGLLLQTRIDAQSRATLALVAVEIALARDDPSGAWDEVAAVIDPGHRGFAAYDLPLLAAAAHVLARAQAAGLDLGSPPDELEARLRALLADVAFWPTAPAFVAVFEAELARAGVAGAGTEGSGAGGATPSAVPAATPSAASPGADPSAWEAATAVASGPGAPARLEPYTRLRWAEVLAVTGDRAAAQAAALAAREKAEAIGHGFILNAVADLERRLGLVRASSKGPSESTGGATGGTGAGPVVRTVEHDLTERERQVLDLLSQGLGNRQIAERLFISTKTASVHVSNILRKTNTATRTEAAFLARSFAGER
ncbi:helix-turn-helix transcriptional regulator [Herbiconiux sp.]|uniref:helix-turn-helix transcriptional regulator n=1 Tax=Herbiconiux sp. TaxID=1871186 RepID=UPI0025C51626|nr:helix-turn-helix transcriptional regulator [Herbiconiux sp.]